MKIRMLYFVTALLIVQRMVFSHSPKECLDEKYNRLSAINNETTCFDVDQDEESATEILENPARLSAILCTLLQISRSINEPIVILTDYHHNDYIDSFISTEGYHQNFDLHPIDASARLREMLYLKGTAHKFFIILCDLQCTLDLLYQSIVIDMLDRSFNWIVLFTEVQYFEENLPETLISMQFDEMENEEKIKSYQCEDFQLSLSKKDEFIIETSNNQTINFPHLINRQDHQWLPITHRDQNEWHIDFRHIKYGFSTKPRIVKTVTIIEAPFTEFSTALPDLKIGGCKVGKLCYDYQNNGNFSQKQAKCCYGHSIDVIIKLEADLNFLADIYIVKDNIYGNEKDDGSWNGMVGDLVNGKAELLVGAITIFEKRFKVIDFTDPYMLSGVGIAAIASFRRPPFANVDIFSSISWKLWIILFGLVFTCAFLLYFSNFLQNQVKEIFEDYSVHDAMLYLSGVMFSKDVGGKDPPYMGGKVISVSFAVLMLIVMSSLTAVLTANRVSHVVDLPITGFNDEKITDPTPSFKYATRAESGIYERFGDSANEDWGRMYKFMRPYNYLNSLKAVEQLKDGYLGALVGDVATLNYYASLERDCKLRVVGNMIEDAGYGLATRKGSTLAKKLNTLVQKYTEDGTLVGLEKKWFPEKCVEAFQSNEGASLYTFGGLFLMILTCSGLSLIAFIIETIYGYFKEKKTKHENKIIRNELIQDFDDIHDLVTS